MMRIDPKKPEAMLLSDNSLRADTLEELLEMAFPLDADDAVLYWNEIPVPISYKYDLPVMLEEIEEAIGAVNLGELETSVQWPSNTFRASWVIRRCGERVKIAAEWESVAQDREAELNESGVAEVSAAGFLEAWSKLLCTARTALLSAGYTMENCRDWDRLESIIEACGGTRPS